MDDVSDEQGWIPIKQSLIKNTGMNSIPHVFVNDISDSGDLILIHEHDGRDLELGYAESVVRQVNKLWNNDVKLFTVIEDETWEI